LRVLEEIFSVSKSRLQPFCPQFPMALNIIMISQIDNEFVGASRRMLNRPELSHLNFSLLYMVLENKIDMGDIRPHK
jgi:hypothetical protein